MKDINLLACRHVYSISYCNRRIKRAITNVEDWGTENSKILEACFKYESLSESEVATRQVQAITSDKYNCKCKKIEGTKVHLLGGQFITSVTKANEIRVQGWYSA